MLCWLEEYIGDLVLQGEATLGHRIYIGGYSWPRDSLGTADSSFRKQVRTPQVQALFGKYYQKDTRIILNTKVLVDDV